MQVFRYPPTAVTVAPPAGAATEAKQDVIIAELQGGVPVTYFEDAVETQVNTDSVVPANNRGLPSAMYITRDGVQLPVTKDTGVPANTVGIPVELVASSGTPINITAGDLNVQLSHLSPNYDSTRIGDGTNLMGVNANLEALVHDADVLTQVSGVNSKTFSSKVSSGNSTIVPLGSGATFTGTSEEITNYAAITTTIIVDRSGTFFTEYSNDGLTWDSSESFTVSVTSPGTPESFTFSVLPEAQYFRARYINGGTAQGVFKIQTILKVGAVSGEIHQVGFALNARTEAQVTKGVIYGVTTGGGGGYVAVKVSPSGALAVDVTQGALTPTFAEILNLTNVAQTFTAPSNARWVKIYADDTNTANIRVKIGGTATTSSGIQFQPGRSEDYTAVGNISVIAESGTNQKICVQWGAA